VKVRNIATIKFNALRRERSDEWSKLQIERVVIFTVAACTVRYYTEQILLIRPNRIED